jgi:hypothetical protein
VYTPDDAVRAISFSSDHNMLAYSSQSAEGQQGSLDVVGVQSGAAVNNIAGSPDCRDSATKCSTHMSRWGHHG